MSYKRKTINESKIFRLVELRHRKQKHGDPMYEIIWHSKNLPNSDEETVRNIVDPNRNIGGTYGSHWKFRDRNTAEKLYTMLVLKWS